MGQDGASHDGKVGVGAQEIVGELLYKIKQLHKGAPVDLHGHMLLIEHDAVLIIIYIGGILEAELLSAHGQGNDPVVVPGRMVCPPGIAHVLHA